MHPTIQTILGVRDKDLQRWGRSVAVFMFCAAIIFCVSAVALRRLVDNEIGPGLRAVTKQESVYLERYADPEHLSQIRSSIDASRRADESVLRGARAAGWLMASLGLISFLNGVLFWRSYELASSICNETERDSA